MIKHLPDTDPESLAINALGFLAEESERLARFLGLTGLEAGNLRQAAGEPHFLGSVLDHLMNDEALLLAFCADRNLRPDAVVRARQRLPG